MTPLLATVVVTPPILTAVLESVTRLQPLVVPILSQRKLCMAAAAIVPLGEQVVSDIVIALLTSVNARF
jgi:hypothetical protein